MSVFSFASPGNCYCQISHVCLNRGTSKELKYCNDCNGRKYSDITVHLGGHECKSRCEDSSTEREIARHDIHFHPSWRGKTKTGYDLGKEAITYKRGCKYFVIYLRSRPVDPDVVCYTVSYLVCDNVENKNNNNNMTEVTK